MGMIFDEIIEHQKKFIGFLLKDSSLMEYVAINKIIPEMFYINKGSEQEEKESTFTKKIFEVLMACHDEFGISDANVIDKFNFSDVQKKSKLKLSLQRLKLLAKDKADFYLACKKIKSSHLTNALFNLAETIIDDADHKIDGSKIYDKVFESILNMDSFDEKILEFDAVQLSDQTKVNIKRRIRGEVHDGVKTHIETLDKEIKCLYFGMPSLVLARPGHGKSTLMANAFYNNIVYDEKPIYVSLEMPPIHLMFKLLAIRTGIDLKRILKPMDLIIDENVDEFAIIEDAIDWFCEQEFYILDANGMTAKDVFIYMNKYQQKGCTVMYLDYFQRLLRSNGKMPKDASDYSEICMEVTSGIKQINRRGNMALCMGVQSARVEHRPVDDRLPRLSDLQWTSALEQDAAVIISIMLPEKYEGDDCTRKNIMVAGFPKHRYENAIQTELAYMGSINKIGNLRSKNRIEKEVSKWTQDINNHNKELDKKDVEQLTV